jgi:hypothetical protein
LIRPAIIENSRLQPAQQGAAVADAGIAGHSGQLRVIGEVPHQPADGMGVEQGIAIDAHQQLVAGRQGSGTQARPCPGCWPVAPPQPRLGGGQGFELGSCVVAAAIVDGDHLESCSSARPGQRAAFQPALPIR